MTDSTAGAGQGWGGVDAGSDQRHAGQVARGSDDRVPYGSAAIR